MSILVIMVLPLIGAIGIFLSSSKEMLKKVAGFWIILFFQVSWLFIGISLIARNPSDNYPIVFWLFLNAWVIVHCCREMRKMYQSRKRTRSGKKTVG
ncbi:hypothetical protein [Thalassobacillus pellis]|uniref:hypothetical protein n=1 Tax=Thalassobacillus pellis TaxID=748008 RepID=UPI001960DB3F|nr:hypothetical protein [Thalassobacillus pellis]MBM7554544.1 multisubunit Na+/H+ antiporter MnhC subunit [Thalassobacillus pellis]